MSLPQHTVQAVGAGLTGTGAVASFIAAATPIMQFALIVVSFVVGVLTAVYTWKRIRAKKLD